MIYPRFKIGLKMSVLILVAIFLVTGAFVMAEYQNKKTEKTVYNATVITPATSDTVDLELADSDADGLKDWEEIILGTDPRNPDTDKDGTPDGTEVTLNRNPLIKGPKDSSSVTATSNISAEKLTPTDKLARDFFARYMELRKSGLSDDKQSQQELIGTVLKNGIILETVKLYTLKNILTTSDTSKEAVAKYANEVGTVFNKYQHDGRDEGIIVKDSLEKEDPDILKEIDPIIIVYKNTLNAILKIPAPTTMATTHLNLVNAVNKFLFNAESFRKTDVDPMKGIQGATGYLEAGKSLINAFQAIKDNLSAMDIVFSPSDPGYIFQN